MYRCLLSLAPEVSEPSKALNHNTTATLLSLSTAHRLQGIGDRSVSATPNRQRSVLMKFGNIHSCRVIVSVYFQCFGSKKSHCCCCQQAATWCWESASMQFVSEL